MKKVAIISKYLPSYRLAVFNKLSQMDSPKYKIVGDIQGREGIKTISWNYSRIKPANGGLTWENSKSFYYKKSLQFFQTNVVSKIFSKEYDLFILDGATSHISTWLFAILCKFAGKKSIFWSHGLKGTDKGLKKIIRIFFFKYLPDGLILYGEFSKKQMIKEGFDPCKIFVIGNSLDYENQKLIRHNLLKEKEKLLKFKKSIFIDDNNTVLFIGRLQQNKRVDKLVQSLINLNKEGVKLNCIIIGDGPVKGDLKNLIKENQFESQVYFANALYDEEEIAKLFLISNLMISPGNVGLNCIHSLSYGVPVLTHDNFSFQNPEVEAILPYKNGLLYKHNDFNDMTSKIRTWFSIGHTDIINHCLEPIEKKFNPLSHANYINKAVLEIIGK